MSNGEFKPGDQISAFPQEYTNVGRAFHFHPFSPQIHLKRCPNALSEQRFGNTYTQPIHSVSNIAPNIPISAKDCELWNSVVRAWWSWSLAEFSYYSTFHRHLCAEPSVLHSWMFSRRCHTKMAAKNAIPPDRLFLCLSERPLVKIPHTDCGETSSRKKFSHGTGLSSPENKVLYNFSSTQTRPWKP